MSSSPYSHSKSLHPLCCGLLLLAHCFGAQQGKAQDPLQAVILPETIELTHAGSSQGIQLQRRSTNGVFETVVSEGIEWRSSDESVFRIEKNRVVAVGNGTATLHADRTGSPTVTAKVTVQRASEPIDYEFRNHVQAVFARAGCNMGSCHGALAGKGGFRLSLRGYDVNSDHFNVTRQDRGRRIELSDVGQSLLLTKPSGAIPHKGGLRLPTDSLNYDVVAHWIAQGAKPPTSEDPRLAKIEVKPNRIRMQIGETQPLIVLAHYSNGRIEDVTHWAKYNSTDDSVLNVDEHGSIKIIGPGEGSVVVWFASQIVMARMTVPFPNVVPEKIYQDSPIANFIDRRVLDQLQELKLAPSPRCEDHEFVRRAFLDTLGMLPKVEEVNDFVADRAPDKRSRLIDNLLDRPEFVDYWAYRWSDMLMLNGNLLRPDPIKAYYDWIRKHVKQNTPWDKMVREILTAQGESLEHGETNFYALNQDPESMTENACQAFMGLSIGCAKCHNHPLEKWTNDQYYAMANLFARVRAKGWGGDSRDGDGKRTLVVLDRGELIQPLTGKPQLPAPLDAPPLDPNSKADRRAYLADWMVSPDNPYFTRAIVNRIWANFFGIGIVNAIDDLRASNPPSNPALMNELEKHLVANRYDLKSLMRVILESETYQRSSMALPENSQESKYFSRCYPKRLSAEVMHDAICQVSGMPTKFTEIEYQGADKKPTNFYPEGTRAIQLYDSAVRSYFLKTFGRNQRRITCECERSDEPSVVQVLHLSNGSTLNEKLSHKDGWAAKLLADYGSNPDELIRVAYMASLSRQPHKSERTSLVQEIESATNQEEKRLVVEDLLWGLMTSREFLFNH